MQENPHKNVQSCRSPLTKGVIIHVNDGWQGFAKCYHQAVSYNMLRLE
jgi:hypothetical protein